MASTYNIALKRAYEPASPADGSRILVERLWPRGVSKERAALDGWLKDVAPSPGLRAWYAHDPSKWLEFQKRYRRELGQKTDAISELKKLTARGKVSFIYAARDEARNSALVLKQYLDEKP